MQSTTTTSSTINTWQLSWNHKSYESEKRMLAAAALENDKYVTQSWGRSSTKNISKIKMGDTIYISCRSKCIAKATVTKEFYQTTQIEDDRFCKPETGKKERHKNLWYCQLYITEIYLGEHQKKLRGNQNTFCNPSNAFWKNN